MKKETKTTGKAKTKEKTKTTEKDEKKKPTTKKKPSLYKYTSLEYLYDILENSHLYLADLYQLNDPYEYRYKKDCNSNIRVLSLTRSYNAKLMWSHYADGHRGVSIQIELPEGYDGVNGLLRQVTYVSTVNELTVNKLTANEIISFSDNEYIDLMVKALYTKDKKWNSEIEHRVVCRIDNLPDEIEKVLETKDGNPIVNYYYHVKIIAINLGCEVNMEDEGLIKALEFIKKHNDNYKNNKIKVNKYMKEIDSFKFVQDKENFNFESYLPGGSNYVKK